MARKTNVARALADSAGRWSYPRKGCKGIPVAVNSTLADVGVPYDVTNLTSGPESQLRVWLSDQRRPDILPTCLCACVPCSCRYVPEARITPSPFPPLTPGPYLTLDHGHDLDHTASGTLFFTYAICACCEGWYTVHKCG